MSLTIHNLAQQDNSNYPPFHQATKATFHKMHNSAVYKSCFTSAIEMKVKYKNINLKRLTIIPVSYSIIKNSLILSY
jgi:hypothetical protein